MNQPKEMTVDGYEPVLSLLCRVHGCLCALSLGQVVETMRPLPIEPLQNAPSFVRGLSVIRGAPVPVLDVAHLLNGKTGVAGRFVTIAVGDRRVALAVEAVLGVRPVPAAALQALPPLLRRVEVVSAIATLDAELLVVLEAARLMPDDLWPSPGADERLQ